RKSWTALSEISIRVGGSSGVRVVAMAQILQSYADGFARSSHARAHRLKVETEFLQQPTFQRPLLALVLEQWMFPHGFLAANHSAVVLNDACVACRAITSDAGLLQNC